MSIGIESISFYSSHYYIDLKTLATARNVDFNKYYKGIGQEKMAVPPPDEDVVTMAANAAHQALENVDRTHIDTLMFATESGIDQSKAGGIYVHQLLDLSKNCRVVELKQACYSGTAGMQFAFSYIATHPEKKVLILASDIARYALESPGEPTQGAAAIAMVLSADPKIMSFDTESGLYTEDVMDFWRPNYLDIALVDGKYSVKIYLKSLLEAWQQYHKESGREVADFSRFCYHLPFTRMGEMAHQHLLNCAGNNETPKELAQKHIKDSLIYNRITGNSYTASLCIGLTSLLENDDDDLSGKRIGMFSYGSGCMAEFFSGVVSPEYRKYLLSDTHHKMLDERQELTYPEYEQFYTYPFPTDGGEHEFPKYQTGRFRLSGINKHMRNYEKV